ncbi:hypothetical protein BGZ76_002033 [Entomortierella beljakovae]|nr:hypothetical protein BGZ76_002033 [Entomortierella beljakovae]
MAEEQTEPRDSPRIKTLPIECINYIISRLSSDRRTLHNLLFINKLFFYEAARHLYRNFFDIPPVDYMVKPIGEDEYSDKIKLQSIVFISFLQKIVKESMDIPGNDKSPSQIAGQVLKEFGLQMNFPYRPSGIALFQDICGAASAYDDIQCDPNAFSQMTTDYSILLPEMSRYDFRRRVECFGLKRILNIANLTYYLDNIASDTSMESLSTDNSTNASPEESIRQNSSVDLTTLIFKSDYLWIHYNHDYITYLTFDNRQSDNILQYSTKLSKLEKVRLVHDSRFGSPNVEAIVSFIKINQSTFPSKAPLEIEFGDGWFTSEFEWDEDHGMDYDTYTTMMKKYNDTILRNRKPVLTIIEAVKKPLALNILDIPGFYNNAHNIETDQLIEFRDEDQFRIERGEGESMREFFLTCRNLRRVEVTVEHQEASSWISQEIERKTNGHSIMKLEELVIYYCNGYRAATLAFNDAMKAFASTLKCVTLGSIYSRRYYYTPNVAWEKVAEKSLELQHNIATYTIGDFPFLLPNLMELTITLPENVNADILSLDNCPNLKSLCIEPLRNDIYRNPELNLHSRQASQHSKDCSDLFPVWNLPKLKNLYLEDKAASRFNLASLSTMQGLKSLSILARPFCTPAQLSDYLIRQHQITSTSLFTLPDSGTSLFGSYSNLQWPLPYLSTLSLSGPSASIFCLESLRFLPSLKTVTLHFYKSGPSGKPLELRRGTVPGNNLDTTPLNDSQMEEIKMYGDWAISSSDLISLLTCYTPFLQTFVAPSLVYPGIEGDYHVLEAFNQADKENSAKCAYESEGNPTSLLGPNIDRVRLPGRQLTSVRCSNYMSDFTLSAQEIEKLGMKKVEIFDEELYKKRRLRIYQLQDCLLVRKQDHELIEKEKALAT